MTSPSYIVVDTETTGLHFMRDKMHGLGVALPDGPAQYFRTDAIPDWVKDLLANPNVSKVGHNLHAFDAKFIRRAGLQIEGEFEDTMVVWNLVDPDSPLGLKWLTSAPAPQGLGKPENLEKKRRLDQIVAAFKGKSVADLCQYDLENPDGFFTLDGKSLSQVIGEYCCEDVENTRELYELGLKRLAELNAIVLDWNYEKGPLDYWHEEAKPLERVLFEMEYRGIRLDLAAIEKTKKEGQAATAEIERKLGILCADWISQVEEELHQKKLKKYKSEKGKKGVRRGEKEIKFSWQNTGHVTGALFKYGTPGFKYFISRTDKGTLKLDKIVIEEMAKSSKLTDRERKIAELYAEYKKWQKILTTYTGDDERGILSGAIQTGPNEWRVFPKYRQTTGTGRLACSDPNMQNLPRNAEVKRFFIPDSEDEVFDDADYSQIELRVAAHLSNDPTLCGAYLEDRDVHLLTSSNLFGRPISKNDEMERQAGKRTNFLTIYRGSAYRLQQSLLQDTGHLFSKEQCQEFIDIWFETYPGVRRYLDQQQRMFFEMHAVVAPNGRIRRLPDLRFKPEGFKAPWNFKSKLTGELIERWRAANPKAKYEPNGEELGEFAYKLYAHALKAGYNQPIQSGAGTLTKKSMIRLHNLGRKIANTVHDNLTVSRKRGDTDAKIQLISIMENIEKLRVPLKADCKTIRSFHPLDKEN